MQEKNYDNGKPGEDSDLITTDSYRSNDNAFNEMLARASPEAKAKIRKFEEEWKALEWMAEHGDDTKVKKYVARKKQEGVGTANGKKTEKLRAAIDMEKVLEAYRAYINKLAKEKGGSMLSTGSVMYEENGRKFISKEIPPDAEIVDSSQTAYEEPKAEDVVRGPDDKEYTGPDAFEPTVVVDKQGAPVKRPAMDEQEIPVASMPTEEIPREAAESMQEHGKDFYEELQPTIPYTPIEEAIAETEDKPGAPDEGVHEALEELLDSKDESPVEDE